MIKEVTMYTVVCDNCGKDSNEDSEYSAYCDKNQAVDVAKDWNEWIEEGDKHYCRNCFSYDDNDNLILKPIKK